MRPIFFILLLSLPLLCFSQASVFGKVLEESTGLPLSKASVYINNSTIGTVTNDSGYFDLHRINPGFYDIIVSYVGYTPVLYRLQIQDKDFKITFRLQKKQNELRNIVVTTKKEKAEWMRIFREHFLGVTQAANNCRILNEDEVLFEEGDTKKEIRAFSAVPLEVVNDELGYMIYFQLERFSFDPISQKVYFYGYTRFEDLLDRDGKLKLKYVKNRERYYKGSTMNFYHSLLDNKLSLNHFSIFDQNNKAYSEESLKTLLVKDSAAGINVYRLNIANYLEIRYSGLLYGSGYLARRQPFSGMNGRIFTAKIRMVEPPALIDQQGGLENPLAVMYEGYWGFERVANMLPVNYRPAQ